MLTSDALQRFHQDGCLVLPDFKPASAMAALRARALQIVEGFDPSTRRAVFTTNAQVRSIDRAFFGLRQRSALLF